MGERGEEESAILGYQPPPPPPAVPTYRKIMAGVLVLAGLAVAIMAVFSSSPAARENTLLIAGGLIVWGIVVRFQQVRLW